MKIKRILLTGDDGFNSIGTRLLISQLKDRFELTVVGTKTQQSGVGGKLHVKEGCSYGETTLDGIKAFWVDGAPGDAMEFAHQYFKEPFDCVISGINLGENVGPAMVASGTVCAAVRALGLKVAPHAIALSWTTPPDFFFKKHDENESIAAYLTHPGESTRKLLDLIFAEDFFGARLLNVNIPKSIPKGAVFTRPSDSIDECYPPVEIDTESMRFSYPFVELVRAQTDLSKDVEAMAAGFMSVTPMNADWTDDELFTTLGTRKIVW